jgi:hypothetical protein
VTGQDDSGAVYLFIPDASGTWVLNGYLKSPAPDQDDSFGTSVAHGNGGVTIAVGATGEDGSTPGVNTYRSANNAASNAGVVYLF